MENRNERKGEGEGDAASGPRSPLQVLGTEDGSSGLSTSIAIAPALEDLLDEEIERIFMRYGYVALDERLYWVPDTSPIRIHNDGEQIGYLFASRELDEPLWTVNRHRDGILVLWPFDREPHQRVVTTTRHISQIPKFIQRDSDSSRRAAGPQDGAKRTGE